MEWGWDSTPCSAVDTVPSTFEFKVGLPGRMEFMAKNANLAPAKTIQVTKYNQGKTKVKELER